MAAKAQHYLPRAYFRPFTHQHGKSRRLWFFDKFTGKEDAINVNEVCQERWFYDFTDGAGQYVPVDSLMQPYENRLLGALHEVRTDPTAATLEQRRKDLAELIGFLMARSVVFRQELLHTLEALAEADPDFQQPLPGTDEVKYDHVRYMSQAVPEAAKRLYEMKWVLVYNQSGVPFYTSDYPFIPNSSSYKSKITVDRNNQLHLPSPVQILYEPGIELFVPLAPDLGIIFTDPIQYASAPALFSPPAAYVETVNRAHVLWCRRFIYSSRKDFTAAKKMLKENPHLGNPERRRITVKMDAPAGEEERHGA